VTQEQKNVKHGMSRRHVSQWAKGVCYCRACMELRGAFDDERKCPNCGSGAHTACNR